LISTVALLACIHAFAQVQKKGGKGLWLDGSAPPSRAAFPFPEGEFRTSSGNLLNLDHLKGEKVLFFLFALDGAYDEKVGEVVEIISRKRAKVDLHIIGVNYSPGKMDKELRNFLDRMKFSFPVILDPGGDLVGRLEVKYTTDLIYFNREGHYVDRISGFTKPELPNPGQYFQRKLEELVGIKTLPETEPQWGIFPEAPGFTFTTIGGEKRSLEQLRGKVVILAFFSPSCSECLEEIDHLKNLYDGLHHHGLEVILVSTIDAPEQLQPLIDFKQIAPFHVTTDKNFNIRTLYNHLGDLPESYIIDRDGKIRFHHRAFKRVERRFLGMEVRQLLGIENELRFYRKQYGTAEMCRICHEREYFQWKYTRHAVAFDTLLTAGKEHDTECLPCHVLACGKTGGFDLDKPIFSARLEGVQCETCHGYGGPHRTVEQPQNPEAYKAICLECHTGKFSPNFDFHKAMAEVDHRNAEALFTMSEEERTQYFGKRKSIQEELLAPKSSYIGANACKRCHEEEYASWVKTPHAHAFKSLADKKEMENTACINCHVTGYGLPGGYAPEKPKRLKHVQCEACHGPALDHVKADDFHKKSTIIGLGDKCDECGVEQICLRCHDVANDPGFDITKKLDLVRHHGK